jgi:CHAT domain-containing protein
LEKATEAGSAQANAPERGVEGEMVELPRLPETEREVASIAALYPPSEVSIYRRQEATEAQVKENPLVRTARWLHFATHGMLNEERPELSGLLLTRSDRPDDDGILQVYEIFNLELSADLVVLSACETAGAQVTGEGLVGMTRAFFYAGAPSVMASLWRVRDESARQLMVHFYRALDELGARSMALREAKMAMLDGEMAHPSHWAPFVLIGKP